MKNITLKKIQISKNWQYYIIKKFIDLFVAIAIIIITYYIGERMLINHEKRSFQQGVIFQASIKLVLDASDRANKLYEEAIQVEPEANVAIDEFKKATQKNQKFNPSGILREKLRKIQSVLDWLDVVFLQEKRIQSNDMKNLHSKITNAKNNVDNTYQCIFGREEVCPTSFKSSLFKEIAVDLNRIIIDEYNKYAYDISK